MPSAEQFYDSLADAYHLIFDDWERAIARQAHVLDAVISSKRNREGLNLHDCACGIGTQALGLASLGYRVSGSDLSGRAVQRARCEAEARGLHIDFHVSDMTTLARYPTGHFDVLCAFDNALPHLSANQMKAAAHSFRRVLCSDGVFVASIRDYDDLVEARPAFQGPAFFGAAGARRIVHQVWDWTDTDAYDVHQYISLEQKDGWKDLHFSSHYRCLLRAELTQTLLLAGFVDVEWLLPTTTGYYQPIVIGRACS